MSCYVVAHYSALAERLQISISGLIADAECHVLSSWVDSTIIQIQPASRIIHISWMLFNRGGNQCCVNAKRRHNARINRARIQRREIQVLDERPANSRS